MSVWPTGRTLQMTNGDDEDCIAEMINNMDGKKSYGTAVPDSNVPGLEYIRLGDTPGYYARANREDDWTQIV